LRFLKLFRIIPLSAAEKNASAVLVSVLIIAGCLFGPAIFRGNIPERIIEGYTSSAHTLSRGGIEDRDALSRAVREYARTENALLLVKQDASPLYSRFGDEYYKKYFGQEDYLWRRHRPLDFFFDLKPLLSEDARRSLAFFCVLAVLFGAFFVLSRVRSRKASP